MARNLNQYVNDEDSEDEQSLTSLPTMEPIEGGEITLHSQGRGTVGNLHYLPEEKAIAYCSTKGSQHKMWAYSGYAVSVCLFDQISTKAQEMIDEHDLEVLPSAPIYFIFFEVETRDALVFTLEQYQNEGKFIDFEDDQHVLSVEAAKQKFANALTRVVRSSDCSHGYICE